MSVALTMRPDSELGKLNLVSNVVSTILTKPFTAAPSMKPKKHNQTTNQRTVFNHCKPLNKDMNRSVESGCQRQDSMEDKGCHETSDHPSMTTVQYYRRERCHTWATGCKQNGTDKKKISIFFCTQVTLATTEKIQTKCDVIQGYHNILPFFPVRREELIRLSIVHITCTLSERLLFVIHVASSSAEQKQN